MARPSRTALYADDPTFLWKAILRALTILIAIVGVATTAWALSTQNRYSDSSSYYDDSYYSYYADFATLPWTFITLGLSIIWNIANLVVLFLRNRPIHPGANVGCDLVLWLGLVSTGVIETFGAVDYEFDYYGGSTPMRHKEAAIAVGAAMSFTAVLCHFALFISACCYTHARRYGVNSKHAKAITNEATQIAQKMIADMTGPNGMFRPRSQQQHYQQQRAQESQPLMSAPGDMQQQQQSTAYVQAPQPTRQPSVRSSVVDLPPPDMAQRRYEPGAPASRFGESSSAGAMRGPPEIMVQSPTNTHPAFREDGDGHHTV